MKSETRLIWRLMLELVLFVCVDVDIFCRLGTGVNADNDKLLI